MSRITKVELIPVQLPLSEPFIISKGALTHAKLTFIKIYDSDGAYGIGECCPYRSIHGETQEGTVAFGKDLAKALIGLDPAHITNHVALMNKMIVGNASIKCAFDMALYDLNAKKLGLPLYRFLGGSREKYIETDNTVSLMSKDLMVAKASKFVERGFKILKVKLGERGRLVDFERIKAIRAEVGDNITIRIDANQGWNYQDAITNLNAMKDLDVEHCEEPVHADNLFDQQRLTAASPIPIMADEAVFNHTDALRVLKANAADLINIKLGKSGGINNAMKIAGIAEAADVYCQVGSFSESRLGISALVHFDYVWSNIKFHDLDSPLMLKDDPIIGGLTYSKDWQVDITDEPGHGADLDPVFLKNCDIISVN